MSKRKLQDILQERAALLDANEALLGKDELSAKDRATFQANTNKMESLSQEAYATGGWSAECDRDGTSAAMQAQGAGFRLAGDGSGIVAPTPSGGGVVGLKSFRDLFGGRLESGGFANVEDYLRTLHTNPNSPRLKASAFYEAGGSAGGYAVPTEFGAWLLDGTLEDSIVLPRAQVWPMNSETRLVPAWDSANHTAGAVGGLTGHWMAEGATNTDQVGKLRQLRLTARKLAIYTQASSELLADGLSFEAMLGKALRDSAGWYMDEAYLTGSGAGQPLGVLFDPALIVVAAESGQIADTLLYENVINMFARLHPACVARSNWVVNSSLLPQLLGMTRPIGLGGESVPVMQDNGDLRLFGRPVLLSEKLPAVGDQGDILLADFSQYCIGIRREISIDKSNGPGWHEDLSSYRAIVRTDGQGTWAAPITPKHGSTLSWCVTLAAR